MATKSGPQSKAVDPAVVRDPPTRRSTAFDLFGNPYPFLQAKLTVNPPGDRFEREADRVAEAVAQGSSRSWCEVGSFEPAVTENAGVRRGAKTIDVKEKASARAFTFRRGIYSDEGQYNPRPYSGAKLLAHELAASSGALAPATVYSKPLQPHSRPTAARAAPAHAISRPEAAAGAPSSMHALQRSIGNRAVGRLLATRQVIQPRLKIGPVDDPLEREAERVADQVMRTPAPQLPRACCASCAADGPCADELRRRPAGGRPILPRGGLVDAGLIASVGPGRPLPPAERAFFEPRLGTDLGRVRVHDGPAAARVAASVDARAFTLGRDMVFGAGAYAPQSFAGRRLLAHELTHVVQQGGGLRGAGRSIQPLPSTQPVLQRQCLPIAACPILSIDLGGGWPRWEAAEACLQTDYRRQHPGNVVGDTRTWQFLPAPAGSAEREDLDCFRDHLVARGSKRSPGMRRAEPDLIDFTSAELYEITTRYGVRERRARLDALVELANELAAVCSGRAWNHGAWLPSPCYWLGTDLYMRVGNQQGILVYQMLKDASKEALTAALLAAIATALKNSMKLGPAALAKRHPAYATAAAAALVIALVATDAEIAFAGEGEDPILALLKSLDDSGVPMPPDLRAALESDPVLRARLERAMKSGGTASERAKRVEAEMLALIDEQKDQLGREDLEALVLLMEETGAARASPSAAASVERLRERLERIRAGDIPDPGGAGRAGAGTARVGGGGGPGERGARVGGTAGDEGVAFDVPADRAPAAAGPPPDAQRRRLLRAVRSDRAVRHVFESLLGPTGPRPDEEFLRRLLDLSALIRRHPETVNGIIARLQQGPVHDLIAEVIEPLEQTLLRAEAAIEAELAAVLAEQPGAGEAGGAIEGGDEHAVEGAAGEEGRKAATVAPPVESTAHALTLAELRRITEVSFGGLAARGLLTFPDIRFEPANRDPGRDTPLERIVILAKWTIGTGTASLVYKIPLRLELRSVVTPTPPGFVWLGLYEFSPPEGTVESTERDRPIRFADRGPYTIRFGRKVERSE